MKNKIVVGVLSIIVSIFLGLFLSPEMLKPIADSLTLISTANAAVDTYPSLNGNSLKDNVSSVGTLRLPSAYSKADRSCYYCHGYHGDKFLTAFEDVRSSRMFS